MTATWLEAMELLQPYFYGLLMLLAVIQWRRHPGRPAAWLCTAFVILGVVVVAGALSPQASTDPAVVWVGKAMIALLVFFPYSLYRFMGSMIGQITWIKVVAAVLTLGLAVAAFLLPSFPQEGDPRPLWFEIYIAVLLVQWAGLSSLVAARLWRAGRGHPAVARHRMRTMSLGAAGLALALVVAGELSDGGVAALVVQLLALSAGPLMLTGFTPPYALRAWWRRNEDASLTRAEHSLTETTSETELAGTLLSQARTLLAAPWAWLEDREGNVVARDPRRSPGSIDESGSNGTTRADGDRGSVIAIPMRSHRLVVAASPFMPFFGSEEIERLEHLAALADVALSRQSLLEDQRLLAAIVESSNDAIIAKTLDGTITAWNRGAERIYGYGAQEIVGESVRLLLPPGDSDDVTAILAKVGAGEVIDHYETKRRTKQGQVIDVSLSGSPLRDGSGKVVGASVIARDVTEEVRLRAELHDQARTLEAAREEAERANTSKTEFLSRMSHELRTPLNAILGFAQLLEMDDLDPGQRDSTAQIVKGGRRLLELINEVLDIAKVETGQLTMSLEAVPVREAVRSTVDLIRPLADQRSIELVIDIPADGETHVIADRQRLEQVLLNLLSNGVKYNVEGGRVSVHLLDPGDDVVRIGVRDTGPGIADEDKPRLFAPFERLGADQAGIEGTGLGLALSKSLVEAMAGRLEVDSGDGSGSVFWVELPASGPPAAQTAVPAVLDAAGRAEGTHTLLYIEDNLSNRRLIEQVLAHRPGVSLIAAMTGNLGLDLAREHGPDLVLLDVHLPDLEGAEVLARLRKDPRTKEVPVVILSADATPGQIRRFMAAGAQDYLTKPIDVPEFLAMLDRLLAEKAPR
ncbi:MAG: PAS domain S-box protein [Actinobacteria bacterium]|nr:PAS domain S-box protein [Actinomycetota bacterium]